MCTAALLLTGGVYHFVAWAGQPYIYLEGVELPDRVVAGEEFPVAVLIRPRAALDKDLRLFIHFARGTRIVNADVTVPLSLRRWTPGAPVRLGPFSCVIPENEEAGRYVVHAGLFYPGRTIRGNEALVRVPYRNRQRFSWVVGNIKVSGRESGGCRSSDFGGREYAVGFAGSLEKVFPRREDFRGSLAREVRVCAAKNEYESFQLVVIPGAAGLRGVGVVTGDLARRSGGGTIARDNISIRRVGYVTTRAPYYNVPRVGAWPDPLLRCDGGGVDVAEGRVQPFWVSVRVPADAEAGEYEGWVDVRAEGLPATRVPLSLRVWDFSLPARPSLKTGFDFYEHIIAHYYPRRADETDDAWRARLDALCRSYYLDMLAHRISPIHNVGNPSLVEKQGSNYVLDFGEFASRVSFYDAAGQGDFGIAREAMIDPDRNIWSDGWYGFTGPDAVRGVFRAYGRFLEERGWLGRAYTYIIDERYEGVRALTRLIHEGHRGIRNLLTQTPRDGFPDVDIWCVRINNFDPLVADRFRRMGKEIWLYVASPTRPFPGIVIDGPSLEIRLLPWICRRYGIDGLLYWCVNYWTVSDPWRDPMTWPQQNGNGSLFYPGPEGPVDSIRLEVLRDGLEDYEYLNLLGEAGLDGRHMPGIRAVAASTWECTRSPGELLKMRELIGETLEASSREGRR